MSDSKTNMSTVVSSQTHDDEKQDLSSSQEGAFAIDAEDLPPGYFKSLSFIGTMFAAQSAWAAVSVYIARSCQGTN
jgi:hypothetical protein